MIDKIQKLLAKGQSTDNPHEAAAFLAKAQALMAEHNLSTGDLQLAQIGHVDIKSKFSVSKVKPYEQNLVFTVVKAFGGRVLWKSASSNDRDNWGRFTIIAAKSQLEIIEYTIITLQRRLVNARQIFVSGLPDRANKTVEGNGFALGWVRTVGQTVKAFAASAEQTAALELYESKEFSTAPGKAQVVKAGNAGYIAGREAAIGESLFRPMKGAAAPLSLN